MQSATDRHASSSSPSSSLELWRRFIDSKDEDEVEGEDFDEVDGVPGRKRRKITNDLASITKLWMRERQYEFMQLEYLTVFCGTWNVNGSEPSTDLREWLSAQHEHELPHIYAIGFQELDRSASALITGYSSLEKQWINKVTAALSQKADYRMVKRCRMGGIMLLVFARTALCDAMNDVDDADVGTGLWVLFGRLGNKGGVGVRFQLHSTTVCFVCSHLAAHTEDIEGRNKDFSRILSRMDFSRDSSEIADHDVVFWLGDLNYRLDYIGNDECKKKISKGQLDDLWTNNDQLRREMYSRGAFSEFTEGHITFNPTFKYDPGTDNWDSSAKNRTPAWCDRILWYGDNIKQLLYRSHPNYRLSDHKPVSAVFKLGVKVLKPQLQQQIHEEINNVMLERQHNLSSLPKVAVDPRNVEFHDVKFMELQHRRITLTNTGKVPVQFEFVSQQTGSHSWKPWLAIHPRRGFIHINCETDVHFEVSIERHAATRLNAGKDQLRDNLVIRIQGGDDIPLTVSGNYISSRFGSHVDSLPPTRRVAAAAVTSSTDGDLLYQMRQPMRARASRATASRATASTAESRVQMSVDTEDVIEGKGQLPTAAKAGVPVEVQWLVEILVKCGLDEEKLFVISGMQSELRTVFECLDNGTPEKLERYSHVLMEALLMLLDSYDEPVIPSEFYQRCIDASDDSALSRQVLSTIPENHRNLFEYICEFCRTLLKHSDKNKLTASFLASVFGGILLLLSEERALVSADVNQRCANFVRHFIDVAA